MSARWAARLFPIIASAHVLAQIALCVHAFGKEPAGSDRAGNGSEASGAGSAELEQDSGAASGQPDGFRPGFEAGARVGASLPIGKAGRDADGVDRKLGDLTAWRAPVWLDLTYRVSPAASLGLYGQVGVGGTGAGCTGKCDFSDLRLGVQGQWRFSPGSSIDPWLGLGAGWESLSYRSLSLDRTELLGGPELLLQGGLGLRVEKSLELGPFISVGAGSYLRDSYKCAGDGSDCPTGSSVAGSGLHSWISVGLSARYSP